MERELSTDFSLSGGGKGFVCKNCGENMYIMSNPTCKYHSGKLVVIGHLTTNHKGDPYDGDLIQWTCCELGIETKCMFDTNYQFDEKFLKGGCVQGEHTNMKSIVDKTVHKTSDGNETSKCIVQ